MPAFAPYPAATLPSGFRYPEDRANFADPKAASKLYPWWFVDAASEAGALFWSIRTHDGRNLIPLRRSMTDGEMSPASMETITREIPQF